jgi:hypothetical protein
MPGEGKGVKSDRAANGQGKEKWVSMDGGERMTKRIADIIEKFAVGSLLIGLYQQKALAVFLGFAGIIACLYLTRRIQ